MENKDMNFEFIEKAYSISDNSWHSLEGFSSSSPFMSSPSMGPSRHLFAIIPPDGRIWTCEVISYIIFFIFSVLLFFSQYYIYTHARTHTYTYTRTHTCMCLYMFVYKLMHIYTVSSSIELQS